MGQHLTTEFTQRKDTHRQFVSVATNEGFSATGSQGGPADLVLVIRGGDQQDHRFEVHKGVLARESLYFDAMLSRFRERDQEEVFLLSICDSTSAMATLMSSILNFIYYRKLKINHGNVQEVLMAANYFQVGALQKQCIQHVLRNQLSKNNCIQIYLFSLASGPFELQQTVEHFILDNFEVISGSKSYSKDFVKLLTKDHLVKLISSERLVVSSEAVVYKAIMRWTRNDPKERSQLLPELLKYVHFPLMSRDEVDQFHRATFHVKRNRNFLSTGPKKEEEAAKEKVSVDPVDASELLVTAMAEAKDYFAMDTNTKIHYWSTKDKPKRWPKIIVVMRVYWKPLTMEWFDLKAKRWNSFGEMQNWRSCTAVTSYKSTIYMVGGEENDDKSPTGSRTVNRVTMFDCEKRKWSAGFSMLLARRWAGAIVVDGILYVIGGIGGKGGTYEKRLNSVECLNLSVIGGGGRSRHHQSAKWTMLAPMGTQRSSHTVEYLNGFIYAVGGGDGKEWLSTAEAYDIKNNRWTPIPSLNARRWKCGLVAVGEVLYAVGGMDSPKTGLWGNPLRSVEMYDPAKETWKEVAPMLEPRFGCCLTSFMGKIYVSGGFGYDKSILSTMECYDPQHDKWTRLPGMKNLCGFVDGTLIDKPINLNEN